jgi:hypothetical protein
MTRIGPDAILGDTSALGAQIDARRSTREQRLLADAERDPAIVADGTTRLDRANALSSTLLVEVQGSTGAARASGSGSTGYIASGIGVRTGPRDVASASVVIEARDEIIDRGKATMPHALKARLDRLISLGIDVDPNDPASAGSQDARREALLEMAHYRELLLGDAVAARAVVEHVSVDQAAIEDGRPGPSQLRRVTDDNNAKAQQLSPERMLDLYQRDPEQFFHLVGSVAH